MGNRKLSLLLILVCTFLWNITSLAENKSVQLGDTGITFNVDSSFQIVTASNKKSYSQDLQNAITSDNEIIVYHPVLGSFSVSFDQGKDIEQYDLSHKKTEDIVKEYSKYVDSEEFKEYQEYIDISVYDSGKYKWIKLDISSINLVFYTTVQDDRRVNLIFNTTYYKSNHIEPIIDSFEFGNPSFWSHVKRIANSITSFGRRLLGGFGVYVAWSIVGTVAIWIISLVFTIISSIFKRK